ncbi:uncharacterized protein [Elaeis guineensis]|uniref:uncharacterized protein isoform X1 n=1 Tax=Elaeis guineensis var. tenera TaxID=51953 RepID=UPI003C6D942E
MMGNGTNMVWNTLNFWTAQIMGDTERPKEIDTSNSRRLCRLLLSIVAIIGLTAILTISLLNQPPKRSQRVWLKKGDLNNVSQFFDRMALHLNSIEWQCPCKAMDVVTAPTNGARLVEFFLIDVNDPENVIHVNSIEQFCSVASSIKYFKGFNTTCNKILKETFRLSGWDFMVRSSNLYMNSLKMGSLNPIAFMFDVCNSWAGGLSQASSFFLISNMGMKDEEDQRLDTFLRAIRSSLQICAKYASWPPPDNDIYLAESVRDPQLDNIDETNGANKFDYVVAISFNWTDYFMLCAPSYCEYVEANTVMWVLFAAVAQVGGFVSAMLFALRTVFWPLSCMLFGWPTCIETCLNKRANVDSPRSDERGDILMEAP